MKLSKDVQLQKYFTALIGMPRTQKRLLSVCIDVSILAAAFWSAFLMRLESFTPIYDKQLWMLLVAVIGASIVTFIRLGLYHAVIRYMHIEAIWAVILGSLIACASMVFFAFALNASVPRSVPIIFFCLCLVAIGGTRIVMRGLVSNRHWQKKDAVLIYGAGTAGVQAHNVIALGDDYYTAAFVDDRETKQGDILHGVKVYPSSSMGEVIARYNIKKILLAMPEASLCRRKQVLSDIEKYSVKVQIIPNMTDVVNGDTKIQEFKDVGIEDLLGREQVAPNMQLMTANIEDKVVLVTGAGGSIGSELCRQIIGSRPKTLVLYEICEFALYSIHGELAECIKANNLSIELIPIIGSVQRIERIENVLSTFNVNTVYHTAAYKHVPLVEFNVIEGVRNNVFGTYHTAKAAINAGVESFVLVSTDKAVRPTNVMGATKRLAELVLQALDAQPSSTRFCMVRFGNVLGSSGSVVPLFKEQIRQGGPVTVTHKDITRYFMTIPEAAQLVIQAGAMASGGEVFVLDMGKPVKIRDLAVKMIRLSGYKEKDETHPDGDIEVKCTGLRPGEKLFEELLIGKNVTATAHERIMVAKESMLRWKHLEPIIKDLDKAIQVSDYERIRELLLNLPTSFNPTGELCDLVWQKAMTNAQELPKLKSVR